MNKKNIITNLINLINLTLNNKNLSNEIVKDILINQIHLINEMNLIEYKKMWFIDYKDVISSSKKVVKELTKLL